jgi:hypothetical protein
MSSAKIEQKDPDQVRSITLESPVTSAWLVIDCHLMSSVNQTERALGKNRVCVCVT